jgi:uncharacterized membrane protein YhiD involved in acid resistance
MGASQMDDSVIGKIVDAAALSPDQMILRLLVSAVFGACVAFIYRESHGKNKSDATVMTTTLVLLSILIAMVSMVVGGSVARAFSLVGALSIVRFRTVVEDTRDTAFVIFSVIVGMAAGAGLFLVAVAGIPIVGAIAVVMGRPNDAAAAQAMSESRLTVRLGLGRDPEATIGSVLNRHLESYRLNAIETARQGSALDLHYLVRLRAPVAMASFVAELNQIEGVQSVDLQS